MSDLESRSEEYVRILIDIAMDDDNIVQSNFHFNEMRKIRDEDLTDTAWYYQTASPAGFFAYEDAGMATAGLLAGESLRYRVTQKPEAKENADKAFDGVRSIYNIGKQKVEGYFPKPYDKKISDQISRDQYIFIMRSLEHYYEIADESIRKEIDRMLGKMAEYWISINYSHTYLGLPSSNQFTDLAGSLFLGIMHIAYSHTGDEKFKKEYDRLFREERLGERMPETLMADFIRGKTYDGAMYFRDAGQDIMMKTLALDHLWDADTDNCELWKKSLRAFYEEDLLVQLDSESGLTYFITGFDPKTRKTFLTEPKTIEELEDPLNLQWIRFGGLRKKPGSLQVAYNSTVIGHRLQLKAAVDIARLILEKMTLDKFRSVTVPDQSHMPPNQVWAQQCSSSSCFGMWLWAYWLGRLRKLWSE